MIFVDIFSFLIKGLSENINLLTYLVINTELLY